MTEIISFWLVSTFSFRSFWPIEKPNKSSAEQISANMFYSSEPENFYQIPEKLKLSTSFVVLLCTSNRRSNCSISSAYCNNLDTAHGMPKIRVERSTTMISQLRSNFVGVAANDLFDVVFTLKLTSLENQRLTNLIVRLVLIDQIVRSF